MKRFLEAGASTSVRVEYRVFDRDLRALRDRLALALRKQDGDSRTDLYLVGRRRDRNVKIRDGALHLKALRESVGALERWEPVCKLPFPLTGAWIRGPLALTLGIGSLEAPRELYSQQALLEEVVGPSAHLTPATVEKQRERFSGDFVRAELVRLRVEGQPHESAAVEGSDAAIVRSWVRRLALDRWPNTSYVRWLREHSAKTGSSAGPGCCDPGEKA